MIEDTLDVVAVQGGVELARGEKEIRVLAQRPDLLDDLVWQGVELGFGTCGGHGLRVMGWLVPFMRKDHQYLNVLRAFWLYATGRISA